MLKEWFINLFAIKETRVSTIIFFSCFFVGCAIYQIFKTMDITDNIRIILIYCFGFIAGVNGVQAVVDGFGKTDNQNINNSQEGDNYGI